ncbi:MAG: TonB-dependent receptor, partial [Chryseolinea sp.]
MRSLLLIVFISTSLGLQAQKATINGTVKDDNTGENLIGAGIFNMRRLQGATTNSYGFYSFTQPNDSVRLRISYVGYESKIISFLLSRDTLLNVALTPGTMLNEVVIEGTGNDQIQESSRMGTIDVSIAKIKALPALLGEVDVLKVLQLLPGVQAGAEGSGGLYVRGGGPDQNLILLDGAPVYNVSHLFGFFSVFNADAINHVELVKGGFPARYGGRLSSIIDINMKEGNTRKIHGEGSVGIIASRLTVEGPIGKGKTSFIISGRRTYIDALASPIIKWSTKGDRRAGYYFYDLNAKINHQFNDRNRLFLSLYSGNDKAYAKSSSNEESYNERTEKKNSLGLRWGNVTTTVRWTNIINKKLFSNVSAIYSKYSFDTSVESSEKITNYDVVSAKYVKGQYFSGIRDYAIKFDLDYLPGPGHDVRFGAQAVDHLFSPGVLNYSATEESDTTLGSKDTRTFEFLTYVEDDFLITPALKVNLGLHASALSVKGKFYKSL